MSESLRRAYLQAMGIELWVSRRQPTGIAEPVLLGIGTGQGSTVVVCATPAEPTTPLGRDLERAIEALQGQAPVWAWLDPLPEQDCATLAELIDRKLVTRVLVLGAGLAERLGAGQPGDVVASAAVVSLPGPAELGSSAAARRRAWALLRDGLRSTPRSGRA